MQKIFADYSKLDFTSKEGRAKIFAAVQYFAEGDWARTETKKLLAQVQAFGTTGDFPASILPLIEKFQATPAYDTAFEEIFDIRDYTTSKKNGFQMLDIEDGLTFTEVPIGEKIHIAKMSGAITSVGFNMYGGGLGWHRTLIDDEEYWALEDGARAFVNKAMAHKALSFYALIEAIAAGQNVAWQTPEPAALATSDPTYTANRDAQTLNKAAETILTNIAGKGYGVTPQNANFVVLCPHGLVQRLNRALGLVLQGFAGSTNQAAYRFRIVPTTMLVSLTQYYVCIPKIKAKGGDRMKPTIFNKFDEEAYTDIAVEWMRYGGAIGDQQQFQRCLIS